MNKDCLGTKIAKQALTRLNKEEQELLFKQMSMITEIIEKAFGPNTARLLTGKENINDH